MAKVTKSERVPSKMREKYEEVVALTDDFCAERLNEEYAQLARYAAAAMCRKRPSPVERGETETWACGIIYALGFVNVLFDKSDEFYISAVDLCAAFGVSKRMGYNRSKTIRDALGFYQMDPNWYLPSRMDDNLMAWMISVDGFLVDARTIPREIQEIAFEKGYIPYIPGENS